MDTHKRTWCGLFKWPGKKPFLFGSVALDARATNQEVKTALQLALCEHIPDDVGCADLVEAIPGMIVFISEEETP